MADLTDQELREVLDFLAKWAPDHPELGEGKIIRWQRGSHFISRSRGRLIGFIMQLPQVFRYGKQYKGQPDEQIGWGVTLVVESGPESDRIRSAATHELLTKVERNK
ncbi:MAG TPA: hypothetical protein VJ983_02270, partial [candidate division Zixibacteria bacterium]|nr:hypothetical protein [candidate division Zixibacteria bacterium]